MGGYIQTQNKPKYNIITSWNPIPTVQHDVVNIDILYKFVEHATVKRTSLHPPIHGTVKGTWKNWIYICSSFLFQIILRLSEHLFKFVSTKDAWPWRMTWQIVSFYLKNATGILVEISSEFKDPRILLLDLERWID